MVLALKLGQPNFQILENLNIDSDPYAIRTIGRILKNDL
jgi:hypothetical protein